MSGFSLTLPATPAERDQLIADLWEAGTTGITEDELWLRAFFDESSDRHELLGRFSDFRPVLEEEQDYDWVRHAQEMWRPFGVGRRFWLSPDWVEEPAPEGRFRLPVRPGLACGSGSHPATQLCLQALEEIIGPDLSVLDVGTGSGILAQAAGLLGARFVAACDIDDEATRAARSNLPWLPLFTGSLRSVRGAAFDIVVANLNAATLATLRNDLFRVCRSVVVVSGFRDYEAEPVQKQSGWPSKQTLELEGWGCCVLSRG